MASELTESQEMFKTAARKFLTANFTLAYLREMAKDARGYSTELWKKMTELGWLGLIVPEQYGGAGESLSTMGLLLEEMGRCALPGPFFSTAVYSPLLLLEGDAKLKEKLLPRLCKGDLLVTVALGEPTGQDEASAIKTTAVPDSGGYLLSGTKLFVPYAHVSDLIICLARTGAKPEAISAFLVDAKAPGVTVTPLKTITAEKQCEVVLDKVRVSKSDMIGGPDQGWAILQRVLPKTTVAKCFEMVGGAAQVLEMSVSYAGTRVQSGHPIGSFQAIQHHCANMVLHIETMKHLTYKAAWMLEQGLPCEKEVAMAKACANKNYCLVTFLGHQIHGGIGFCDDHAMPQYFKRAKAAELAFGDEDYQLEKVAQAMGL